MEYAEEVPIVGVTAEGLEDGHDNGEYGGNYAGKSTNLLVVASKGHGKAKVKDRINLIIKSHFIFRSGLELWPTCQRV